MRGSRKTTLIRVLSRIGRIAGVTPGEEAAIAIAVKLIRQTPMKELDTVAVKVRKQAEPFWSKQW